MSDSWMSSDTIYRNKKWETENVYKNNNKLLLIIINVGILDTTNWRIVVR